MISFLTTIQAASSIITDSSLDSTESMLAPYTQRNKHHQNQNVGSIIVGSSRQINLTTMCYYETAVQEILYLLLLSPANFKISKPSGLLITSRFYLYVARAWHTYASEVSSMSHKESMGRSRDRKECDDVYTRYSAAQLAI